MTFSLGSRTGGGGGGTEVFGDGTWLWEGGGVGNRGGMRWAGASEAGRSRRTAPDAMPLRTAGGPDLAGPGSSQKADEDGVAGPPGGRPGRHGSCEHQVRGVATAAAPPRELHVGGGCRGGGGGGGGGGAEAFVERRDGAGPLRLRLGRGLLRFVRTLWRGTEDGRAGWSGRIRGRGSRGATLDPAAMGSGTSRGRVEEAAACEQVHMGVRGKGTNKGGVVVRGAVAAANAAGLRAAAHSAGVVEDVDDRNTC